MKIFFVFIWILSQPVFAQNKCIDIFIQKEIDFQKRIISQTVYDSYLAKISTLKPEIAELFSRGSASDILLNDQAPLTRHRLMNLLDSISDATTRDEFVGKIQEQLENYVPQRQITERIEEFIQKKDAKSLARVLGDKTLQETQELVYGKSLANPSQESLLGRYLAETKALKVPRKYPSSPAQGAPLGPRKYAVSIDATSAELFYKYFAQVPELLFHFHTPRQGTLQLYFNNEIISYAGSGVTGVANAQAFKTWVESYVGTMLPTVLLSTSEANRMQNYVSLARINRDFAKVPWMKLPGYTTAGGYTCCTHWVGEMPIGDKLVKEYTYPGKVDGYANQSLSSEPQTKILEEYWNSEAYKRSLQTSSAQTNALTPIMQKVLGSAINTQQAQVLLDQLTQIVWTVPGRQHFAEMLGQQEAKLRGEFVNPGYVAYTLIGRTKTSRVPLVFYFIHQNINEIPDQLQIHAY